MVVVPSRQPYFHTKRQANGQIRRLRESWENLKKMDHLVQKVKTNMEKMFYFPKSMYLRPSNLSSWISRLIILESLTKTNNHGWSCRFRFDLAT